MEVLGDRPVKFYIGGSSDAATRATDFSATAGEAFTVYGKNILPAGSDPSVGITLTNVSTKAVTKLEDKKLCWPNLHASSSTCPPDWQTANIHSPSPRSIKAVARSS